MFAQTFDRVIINMPLPLDQINSSSNLILMRPPPIALICQNFTFSLCVCTDTRQTHEASDWLWNTEAEKRARFLNPIRGGSHFVFSPLLFANYTEASKEIIRVVTDPEVTAIEPCCAFGVLWNDSIILELGSRRESSQSTIVFNIIVAETYKWRTLGIIVSRSKWNYYGVFGSALHGSFCFPALFQRHWFPTGLN